MTSKHPFVYQEPRNKEWKRKQNNFTRVFPRSDFAKAKISYLCYNVYAEEGRLILDELVSAWSALNFL